MAAGSEAHDLDLGVTASAPLARSSRVALILSGLMIVFLAWPVGYAALVVAGGGHGSPFDGGTGEFAMGVALLAVPVIMLGLGVACLVCTNRFRLRIVALLALALPVDLAIAIAAGIYAMRPPSPEIYPVPISARSSERPITVPGGTTVSIACDPTGRACKTTSQSTPPAAVPPNPPRSEPRRRR